MSRKGIATVYAASKCLITLDAQRGNASSDDFEDQRMKVVVCAADRSTVPWKVSAAATLHETG
jgi:hypothetical protein